MTVTEPLAVPPQICVTVWPPGRVNRTVQPVMADAVALVTVTSAWNPPFQLRLTCGVAVHELAFPFPGRDPDALDLSALNLRVTLREGDASWAWSAGFERLITDYYDPYWYPYDPYWGHPWHFGFHTGVVWCD